jgi:hypothetical protein
MDGMSTSLNILCISKIKSNKIQLVEGVGSCDLKVDSCDFQYFLCTMALLKPPNLKYNFFFKKYLSLPNLGN